MSKLFFDRLVEFKDIDKQIKKVAKTSEEREELWALVEEIIHHKVMGCILDNLPHEHHEEFLHIFSENPHDEGLMFSYLKLKAGTDIEELLKKEIDNLSTNILDDVKSS